MVLKDISMEETERGSENDAELFDRMVANGLQWIANQGFREYTKLRIQNLMFSAQFLNHPQQQILTPGMLLLQFHGIHCLQEPSINQHPSDSDFKSG